MTSLRRFFWIVLILAQAQSAGNGSGNAPRFVANGAAPTCAFFGAGTGATCTPVAGSNDSSGIMTLVTGTTPSANGSATLTFANPYPNSGFCVFMPTNSSSWNARATIIGGTVTSSANSFLWDNNAVALTNPGMYKVSYICIGN